jgi:multidrug efflux pump subunit AcrA (membrane-fusion protein)
MPAEVKLQAYPEQLYRGRLRQIFPSADRAKSIVEVRVTILDADVRVKPEMTASVTFQEKSASQRGADGKAGAAAAASDEEQKAAGAAGGIASLPIVLVPKRALTEVAGQPHVWVVTKGTASRRPVTLGPERLDQVEVRSGVAAGDAVILNPPATLTDRAMVRVKGT